LPKSTTTITKKKTKKKMKKKTKKKTKKKMKKKMKKKTKKKTKKKMKKKKKKKTKKKKRKKQLNKPLKKMLRCNPRLTTRNCTVLFLKSWLLLPQILLMPPSIISELECKMALLPKTPLKLVLLKLLPLIVKATLSLIPLQMMKRHPRMILKTKTWLMMTH